MVKFKKDVRKSACILDQRRKHHAHTYTCDPIHQTNIHLHELQFTISILTQALPFI
jgi:hypothetical protein